MTQGELCIYIIFISICCDHLQMHRLFGKQTVSVRFYKCSCFLYFIPLLLSLCYVFHPQQSRRFWSRIFLADHYPRVTGKLKPRIDRRAVSSRSRKRNPNLRVAAIRRHDVVLFSISLVILSTISHGIAVS